VNKILSSGAAAFYEEIAFSAAFFSYFICVFLYFHILFWQKKEPGIFSSAFLWTGLLSHLAALLIRSQKAGYAPMSNMFESLSVFSFLIALLYLWVELRYKIKVLGPFVISIAFTMIAIASVLPRDIKPLVPALQSHWLALHVLVTFIGEAAFALSYVAALLYLLKPDVHKEIKAGKEIIKIEESKEIEEIKEIEENKEAPQCGAGAFYYKFHAAFVTFNAGLFLSVISYFITLLLIKRSVISGAYYLAVIPIFIFFIGTLSFYFAKNVIILMLPSSEVLEDISYRAIGFGLPVFTLGALVFGAIWAQRAWGAYWSWDPKETWALITWFIYAAYLHARYNSKMKGKAAAYLTVLGFISTLFTYFGVNYLLSGLHSYANF
jgi:cytochrome c-type biogenesis protein CcsB